MADVPEAAAPVGPPAQPRRRSVARAAAREARAIERRTADSFMNLPARLGPGAGNVDSFGTYGFNPITRLRLILDFAYRGSWICRTACKAIPEDMFRSGIDLGSDLDPRDRETLYNAYNKKFAIGGKLTEAATWGRLYGGALAVIMIDGQHFSQPLRLDTVGRGQFCGLQVIDRWMVTPSLNDLVTDMKSPQHLGKPKFYDVNADAPVLARQRIHHSRVIRFEGDDIPYYQRIAENYWSLSVLEPIFDRIKSFDSTTLGTAQLVHRASLRIMKIKKWKEVVGTGGKLLDAQIAALEWLKRFQTNEGLTVIDADDEFTSLQYSFTGLDAVLVQMAQQISGALLIPLVRLFGQSPAGLNSTGDSDWRNYYDSILARQERDARPGLEVVVPLLARSEGVKLPEQGLGFTFVSLWQLTAEQKAGVATQHTGMVVSAHSEGLISRATGLKELRQSSHETGFWTNITDEDIKEAEDEPLEPMPGELEQPPTPEAGALTEQPDEPVPEAADEEDTFLPGRPARRRAFRPRLVTSREDSAGGLESPELDRPERRGYGPIISLHRVGDRDMRGRAATFAGFPVVVEVERGISRWQGSSGGAAMAAPYGYFPGTVGNDGDSVDVFLGPNEQAVSAFVLHQCNPDTRQFHQHKVMLGFDRLEDAVAVFKSFYADGRGAERLMRAEIMSIPQLRRWLAQHKMGTKTA